MSHYNELSLQAVDLGETTRVSVQLNTACQEHVAHTMRRELDLVAKADGGNVLTWLEDVLLRTAQEAACCGEGYHLVLQLDPPTQELP